MPTPTTIVDICRYSWCQDVRHPAADVRLPHRDPQAEPHRPGRHAHPAPHAQVVQ